MLFHCCTKHFNCNISECSFISNLAISCSKLKYRNLYTIAV